MIRTQRYPTIYNNPNPSSAPPPYPAPASSRFAPPAIAPPPAFRLLPLRLPPLAAFTNKCHSMRSACKRGTKIGPKRRKPRRVYSKSARHSPPSVNAASLRRASDSTGTSLRRHEHGPWHAARAWAPTAWTQAYRATTGHGARTRQRRICLSGRRNSSFSIRAIRAF